LSSAGKRHETRSGTSPLSPLRSTPYPTRCSVCWFTPAAAAVRARGSHADLALLPSPGRLKWRNLGTSSLTCWSRDSPPSSLNFSETLAHAAGRALHAIAAMIGTPLPGLHRNQADCRAQGSEERLRLARASLRALSCICRSLRHAAGARALLPFWFAASQMYVTMIGPVAASTRGDPCPRYVGDATTRSQPWV
jgi:hypothetical protein